MSFGGHVQAMITSLKNNKSILKRRTPFKTFSRYAGADKSKKIKIRKPSEKEIAVLREKIKRDKARSRKKKIFSLLVAIIVSSALMYFGYRLFELWLNKLG